MEQLEQIARIFYEDYSNSKEEVVIANLTVLLEDTFRQGYEACYEDLFEV